MDLNEVSKPCNACRVLLYIGAVVVQSSEPWQILFVNGVGVPLVISNGCGSISMAAIWEHTVTASRSRYAVLLFVVLALTCTIVAVHVLTYSHSVCQVSRSPNSRYDAIVERFGYLDNLQAHIKVVERGGQSVRIFPLHGNDVHYSGIVWSRDSARFGLVLWSLSPLRLAGIQVFDIRTGGVGEDTSLAAQAESAEPEFDSVRLRWKRDRELLAIGVSAKNLNSVGGKQIASYKVEDQGGRLLLRRADAGWIVP